jgi:hypothetical protein
MSFTQLRGRCPSAAFLFKATLPGRQIAFTRTSLKRKCGVADIVQATGGIVWGAVFEISDDEIPALDGAEGVDADAYQRRFCTVFREGDPQVEQQVQAYFAIARPGTHVPNAQYLDAIITGAIDCELPPDYIAELRKIPTHC